MTRRRWPRNPDEAPSADDVAGAFVAACRATGELDRLTAHMADGGGLTDLIVRGRWVAVEALNILYPRVGLDGLARVLGGSNGAVRMTQVRKAGWWDAALVERALNEC